MTPYALRMAKQSDLDFLFNVSTEAMRPVHEALHPSEVFDRDAEFEKYKAKFEPEKIQIIQFEGEDVGRLRVVWSTDSIYVGGIQLLPAFQGKGIGGAVMSDLIEESEASGVPIALEVHDINTRAMSFYTNLGFVETGKQENKTVLRYTPSTI